MNSRRDLTIIERPIGRTSGQPLPTYAQRVTRAAAAHHTLTGLVLAAGALLVLLRNWPPALDTAFTAAFYPAGKQVLHGYLHYDTSHIYVHHIYRYPPIAAFFIAPFALMPVSTAVVGWWIFNAGLITVCCYALAGRFVRAKHRPVATGLLLWVVVSFAPLGFALSVQIDAWVFALVAFAYILAKRDTTGGTLGAGALLGVAASIKLYPLLAVAIIAWLRRDNAGWLLAGAAAAIVACLAIPLLLLGSGPITQFIHVESAQSSPKVVAWPDAIGFLSIAVRALVRNPYVASPGHLSLLVAQGISVLFVVVILGLVVARFWRRRPSQGAAWSIALIATGVCSPYLEPHHLAPIALVLVLLADDSLASQQGGTSTSRLAQLLPVCAACIVCSLLATMLPLNWLKVASVIVIGATVMFLLRRRPKQTKASVLFAGAMVFTATPAFVLWNWDMGFRESLSQVLLGSANLVVLVLMLGATTLIAQLEPYAATGPRPRELR